MGVGWLVVVGFCFFFYLLVKVVVESNQVEVALEALQSPLQEILFGAAALKAKAGGICHAQSQPVLAAPQRTGRLGKKPYNALVCGWLRRQTGRPEPYFFLHNSFFGGKRGRNTTQDAQKVFCVFTLSNKKRSDTTKPNLEYFFYVWFFFFL